MSMPTGVTVLGSTGSIGVSTLDVIARNPERYRVVALTANRDLDRLLEQCLAFNPDYAVMADASAAQRLRERLKARRPDIQVLSGESGLIQVAGCDAAEYVMAAIVGAAGLLPTLEAANKGKRILLANKEALVMSGALFMRAVHEGGATLLPVDSEHNAIFQCMPQGFVPGGDTPAGVRKLFLTASGGPFRSTPPEQLAGVTPEQACAHPNWDMGRKISVDSATMMNKGLEVIEACWLFSLPATQIQVVIHPQSVIHSMVAYDDGSVLTQMGNPDMRTPIAHSLSWPERIEAGVEPLDLFKIRRLDFEPPDLQRFPCLSLCEQAWRAGGTAAAILNSANEVAVEAFLDHRLGFTAIPEVIETSLKSMVIQEADSLDVILQADQQARLFAAELLAADQYRRAPL